MKVRVKLGSQSQVIDFEQQGPTTVRLDELRQSVSRLFHLENNTDFQLSLNQRDALTGENVTLDAFGIVSGDLLHVIGPGLPQANQARGVNQRHTRPQPLTTHSSHNSGQVQQPENALAVPISNGQSVTADNVSSSSEQDSSVSGSGKDTSSLIDTTDDSQVFASTLQTVPEINRYMLEPLVIRESTGHQVPVLLSQLYRSANICSNSDAVWVAVHTLMLESGFLPSETKDPTIMPSDWKRPGHYCCSYVYAVLPNSVDSCSLVGVTGGGSIIVHGLVKSNPDFRIEHLQLRCVDFVRTLTNDAPASYRALDRLSRQFKDTICLPLINELVTAAGYPESQGLQALPYETKLRVISFLDARSVCRLGQTCQEFNTLYRDKMVWRILYIHAFGKPDDCSLSRNWYEMFKVKYRQFREDQERKRRIFYLDETDPPWGFPGSGPLRPVPFGTPFPHILGGDYDVNPEFASGILNPLGGNTHIGPLLPQVAIPDLFPSSSGMLGRPRSDARNLTGSPFSSNFRKPFV